MSDRMQDKLGAHADWKDGHDAFRENSRNEFKFIRNQIAMLIERLNWLENPSSKPQHIRDEENIKLWKSNSEDQEKYKVGD